jgi:hypothetical protein
MRILVPTLALLLAFAPLASFACGPAKDGVASEAPCQDDAWSIYLPGDQGAPAPNIELASFQHMNPQGMAEPGVTHEELMRLHAAIKPLAAAAFAASTTAFEVKVRYTLTPGRPAVFDMQTTGGEAEYAMLARFHESASALTDFHSTAPAIYVLFHYVVSPRQAAP